MGLTDRTPRSMFAQFRNKVENDIFDFVMTGDPVSGTSGTGVGVCGFGSIIQNISTGVKFMNTGTKASPTWTAVQGNHVVAVTSVILTSAQIKVLRATPITIVAAPGAGFTLEMVSGTAHFVYGGTNAFTSPQNLAIKLKDGSGLQVSGAIAGTGFLDQTASQYQPIVANAAGQIATKTNSDNQPLVIHNTGAGEIAGNAGADNTIKIKLAYRVNAITW